MLEDVDLKRKASKQEYKAVMPGLREQLYDLQKACWDASIPSMIVFEGWKAADKGSSIRVLTSRLDPRGFSLHAVQPPRSYEASLPWLWRFWQMLPNYGEMAIFDRSWYRRVLVERVEGLTTEDEWRQGYSDITDFERTLSDDGYVVIKLFLHISRKEQKRRFLELEGDPLTSWRVAPDDWEQHRLYKQYEKAVEDMLEQTDTEWAPWTIVEATDRRWARMKLFRTVAGRLAQALAERGYALPSADVQKPPVVPDGQDVGTGTVEAAPGLGSG